MVAAGPRPAPAASVKSFRTVATSKAHVIQAQLREGCVEVNIAALPRKDVEEFLKQLSAAASRLTVLKLMCLPRDTLSYELDSLNDPRAAGRLPAFQQPQHHDAVAIASAHMQHASVRFRLYPLLERILRTSPLTELQLGMRLSCSGYAAISRGLAHCPTLRRLSFAGSHMGDMRLMELQEGLAAHLGLEELDLTACRLTDQGVSCVADIIKMHAKRRVDAGWVAGLRQYPDLSLDPSMASTRHYQAMRDIAQQVDAQCGGLLHLELAENPEVTDRSGIALCDALSLDRRLILLSLRACGCGLRTEAEFVRLMRSHRALSRVDLRGSSGPGAAQLGILKLHKEVVAPLLTAAGFASHAGAGAGRGARSPAMTVRSVPFWELREGDAQQGGGRLMGAPELGPSPWATPRQLSRRQSVTSNMSWGDEQLLRQATLRAPVPSTHAHPHPLPMGAEQRPKPRPPPLAFTHAWSALPSPQTVGGASPEARDCSPGSRPCLVSGGGTPTPHPPSALRRNSVRSLKSVTLPLANSSDTDGGGLPTQESLCGAQQEPNQPPGTRDCEVQTGPWTQAPSSTCRYAGRTRGRKSKKQNGGDRSDQANRHWQADGEKASSTMLHLMAAEKGGLDVWADASGAGRRPPLRKKPGRSRELRQRRRGDADNNHVNSYSAAVDAAAANAVLENAAQARDSLLQVVDLLRDVELAVTSTEYATSLREADHAAGVRQRPSRCVLDTTHGDLTAPVEDIVAQLQRWQAVCDDALLMH
ncbi:hypothetical protein V8C86DRAFT_2837750 [Haematococcus lacustris]